MGCRLRQAKADGLQAAVPKPLPARRPCQTLAATHEKPLESSTSTSTSHLQ